MIGKRGQIATLLTTLGFSVIVALAIAIPLLIGGFAITFKIIQLLFFTKVLDGAVPLWAIFAVGFAIVFFIRGKKK